MRRLFLTMTVLTLVSTVAWAVPTLQLHIEGGSYDSATDTWVYQGNDFVLNVAGAQSPAKTTSIADVTLYVSVPVADWDSGGSILIQGAPGETGDVASVYYELSAAAAVFGLPMALSPHGVYPAYYWAVGLPDLLVSAAGETVPDFQEGYDPASGVAGDIQRYNVSFNGFGSVHFDLTGMILPQERLRVAPYSHDAEAHEAHAPEPSTLILALGALGGLLARRMRRA